MSQISRVNNAHSFQTGPVVQASGKQQADSITEPPIVEDGQGQSTAPEDNVSRKKLEIKLPA
jgi:hypothetical protein